MAHKSWWFSQ